ncbi:GNAT family N-acetyltransferase [Hyphomicrobium nitrativorans]|nr:GNAT family N-acetyltransferase [Hyphomicrobium nitrativorans]
MPVPQFSGTRSAQFPRPALGRLVFRRWLASDAETFAALLGNERVWRYLPDPFPGEITRRAAEDLIALSNEAQHHDVYAVEHEAAVVGQARLLFDVASLARDTAEISYWLGDRHWGQGRGTAIVVAFVRDSFSRWPELRTIVARVHKDNHASARVLTKTGFRADRATLTDLWQLYYIARPSAN